MDNLTHSLVGALIGQTGLKRRTGLAMPALILGANLPDIDATCVLFLDGVQHLAWRRGATHGPIAWVVLPLVLAGLLYALDRWQAKRGKRPEGRKPVRFGWLYGLSLLGCLTHPGLDWLNSYGIRLLEPFSHRWFYGDTLFIIDPWLWALLLIALGFSCWRQRRDKAWRGVAIGGLALSLVYIGVNTGISRDYARLRLGSDATAETIALPVPVAFWKRDLLSASADGRHLMLGGYTGPGSELRLTSFGDAYLPACSLERLTQSDPDVRAFLFWSRAPFVERSRHGALYLRDARFTDPRVGDRFFVALPPGTCREFFR